MRPRFFGCGKSTAERSEAGAWMAKKTLQHSPNKSSSEGKCPFPTPSAWISDFARQLLTCLNVIITRRTKASQNETQTQMSWQIAHYDLWQSIWIGNSGTENYWVKRQNDGKDTHFGKKSKFMLAQWLRYAHISKLSSACWIYRKTIA